MAMKIFRSAFLPWVLALLLAAALVFVVASRRERAAPAGPVGASHDGHAAGTPSPAATPGRKILYWVDPMVPGYKSDKPGKSPFMDMDLVPVYDDGSSPGGGPASVGGYASISISPERQQAIGIQLGKAEVRELAQTIRAVGRVTLDETLLFQIRSKFEGYVEDLFVDYTGKSVRKGQPLLSIYSPELLATQQEYLLAVRARQNLGTSPNLDVARGAAELYESARQKLLLWDIRPADIQRLESTGQPQKTLTLYSPVDGFVMTKNAVRGSRVMPSDTLFEIGGLSPVWVLADIYESEAPLVHTGDPARMTLSSLPGREWKGKVAFIAPMLEEATRTVKVRVAFPNPDGALKPGMFADMMLERKLGRVLTVPESAVMTTGTRSLVFVAQEGGRLEPREVKTGARVDGYFEIREGVQPGDQVVTQANFLVDSESRLKAALSSFGPASGPTPASPEHRH
jgi:membrane fusion protein, copper/silver efflux system